MTDTTTKQLDKLKQHYLTYTKLIDAGLIIAVTPFTDYLNAVGFDTNVSDRETLYRLAFIAKESEY